MSPFSSSSTKRRCVAVSCLILGIVLPYLFVSTATAASASPPPNFVIIFIDDMGYADIGPFGAEGYETPNLDRMAKEGRRFTDFYVGAPVCSASRAARMSFARLMSS